MTAFTDPRVRAMCNGATSGCRDGLVTFMTEDGPDTFACMGCASCRPAPAPRPAGSAFAAVFAGADDNEGPL